MKLIANEVNNNYFREIPEMVPQATRMDVAVAYITDSTLFDLAIKHNKPFNVWCRIDREVSLDTLSILQKCIRLPNVNVYATHKYLHAKVIWLHGVGCYIGSANLSSNALYSNIELGVFYDQKPELLDFFSEIQSFFTNLTDYTSRILPDDLNKLQKLFTDKSNNLEIENAKEELRKREKAFEQEWEKLKSRIFANQKTPLSQRGKGSTHQKRIVDEWKTCQKLIGDITDIYKSEYQRPVWVSSDVEYYSELDKMFDWYYCEHIQTGDKRVELLINEHHQKNLTDPYGKLRQLFTMWSQLSVVPEEDITTSFNVRTPTVKRLLAKDKILSLTDKELAQVVYHCWALIDHVNQFISYEKLELDRLKGATAMEKAEQYAKLHLSGPNKHGKTILEVLNYFIWNETAQPWEKIWECTDLKSTWKYPGIDRSTLGELIGLARPDKYPVRNNRISRVLYALGFEVDHF